MSRLIDADELKKQAYKSGDWDKPLVVDVSDIDDAPTVDLWHYPSKGEYPDDNEIVLLSIKGRVWKRMEFGQWNGQFFTANDSDYSVSQIRAWMPLPPPPQEEV